MQNGSVIQIPPEQQILPNPVIFAHRIFSGFVMTTETYKAFPRVTAEVRRCSLEYLLIRTQESPHLKAQAKWISHSLYVD